MDFISLKGSNEFLLYKLTTPASSGIWDDIGLITGGGNERQMSHIQFYGSYVPEPTTWAMLITGFGLVGVSMRRRNNVPAVTA